MDEFCDGSFSAPDYSGISAEDLKQLIVLARKYLDADDTISAGNLYDLIFKLTKKSKNEIDRIGHGEACTFFARVALAKNRKGLAFDWYHKALEVDSKAVEYRLELAINILKPLGAVEEARNEVFLSTSIEPNNAKAWGFLGDFERDLGNENNAVACYEKQLELVPDDPNALLDLISLLLGISDYGRAKELINKVLKTDQKGEAYHCLALIAYYESRHEEAIELFDKALACGVRQLTTVKWNKSQALHAIGRYFDGWLECDLEALKQSQLVFSIPIKRFPFPIWKHEPPPASLHIHVEGGAGDNLCCSRYLKFLVDQGYDVRYETFPNMVNLMARNFPKVKIMSRAIDYPGTINIPSADYHLPIGWLPKMFGTDIDTVPWFGSYLKPDLELVKEYQAKLPKNKFKVGLCWSSGIRVGSRMISEQGQLKSMHFNKFKPFFDYSDRVHFVSLQVGPERSQNDKSVVHDLLPERPDWDDTAALIENLDLVISVDTSVMHLAGAMGKPVWVMCMKDCQTWHLMCYREGAPWNTKSSWYPSVRVFRQHRFNEPHFWDEVIEDVHSELIRCLNECP